jgi:hypothetical protein
MNYVDPSHARVSEAEVQYLAQDEAHVYRRATEVAGIHFARTGFYRSSNGRCRCTQLAWVFHRLISVITISVEVAVSYLARFDVLD